MKPAVRRSINRRDFIVSATAAAGVCVLNCDALGQQVAPATMVKALDDPDVIHGTVTFRNGSGEIDGYLSRAAETRPAPGSWVSVSVAGAR